MSVVQTVRGPVDTAALGKVLMHEHVFVLGTEMRENYADYPSTWDEKQRVSDAVAKLTELKSRGIDTIVAVSYTHLRAHETDSYLVCRLLLEKKKTTP